MDSNTKDEQNARLEVGDYISRMMWEDQLPKGADVRQAARDSVIRFARHYGYRFQWTHDQYGERWKTSLYRSTPQRVYGWRSEAQITELDRDDVLVVKSGAEGDTPPPAPSQEGEKMTDKQTQGRRVRTQEEVHAHHAHITVTSKADDCSTSEVHQLKQEIDRLEEEIDSLDTALSLARQSRAFNRAKALRLEGELEQVKKAAELAPVSSYQTVAEIAAKMDHWRERAHESNAALTRCKQELNQCQRELSRATSTRKVHDKRRMDLAEKVDNLRDQLSAKDTELAALKASNAELRRSVNTERANRELNRQWAIRVENRLDRVRDVVTDDDRTPATRIADVYGIVGPPTPSENRHQG